MFNRLKRKNQTRLSS